VGEDMWGRIYWPLHSVHWAGRQLPSILQAPGFPQKSPHFRHCRPGRGGTGTITREGILAWREAWVAGLPSPGRRRCRVLGVGEGVPPAVPLC
jgi:hypothetical protein